MQKDMMLAIYKEDAKLYELGEKTFDELLDKAVVRFEETKKLVNSVTTNAARKTNKAAYTEAKLEIERLETLRDMMWNLRKKALINYVRECEKQGEV